MQPSDARVDRNALGAGIILASVLVMAFADAVVKLVSADLTVWQVFVARSAVAVPVIVGLLTATGVGLSPQRPGWVYVRSGLLVLTWLAYYASLPVLSLSVAAVAVYTNPIWTTCLSAAVAGERVSGRQWLGVVLGFAGVVVILQPGTDAFSWYTLLPLAGAAMYSGAMVLTRNKCRDESPLTLTLALHASFLVAGLVATAALALLELSPATAARTPFLLGPWAPMDAKAWSLMALLGVLAVAYMIGVARAYQIAAPSVVATFDYGYLLSAVLWGFVFFAETPTTLTLCGMAMIVVAGLLVLSRR